MAPPTAFLVAGPPACTRLWDGVQERLKTHGLPCQLIDLFDPLPEDASAQGHANRICAHLAAHPGPKILVAHGTAVPIAWMAAAQEPLDGLVLANGPIQRVDPFALAIGYLGVLNGVFARPLLHPALIQRWLWSSAGLRRTVVNPYVMDRDTVVALSGPILETPDLRRAVACTLRSLPQAVASLPKLDVPTLLVWGDKDPLYSASETDHARERLPHCEHVAVPGGQHFHPVERPWALADEVAAWTKKEPIATRMS